MESPPPTSAATPTPGELAGVWRALDASANRAAEALRVVEDVVRFVFDDQHLTTLAKNLRHDLACLLATDIFAGRLRMRDVGGDVGAELSAAAALPRTSVADLLAANAARGEQALRSLQELSLVVAPAVAGGFERLRYRLYTLERMALGTARAGKLLQGIRLCVLVDGCESPAAFTRRVESLVEAGVRLVQIRDKGLTTPHLVARTEEALRIARRHPPGHVLVVVNDRADIAAATRAAGVHTGSEDLPLDLVRRVVGPGCLLGRTAHTVDEVREAVGAGADYLGVGPCFPSATKAFAEFAPTRFLATVAREIALPTFAIGGITLDGLEALAALGFSRVAVASAITAAADPARAAAEFSARLERLKPAPPAPL